MIFNIPLNIGCVAYNFDKINLYCYLLSSIGSQQENPSFVSGPKFCPDNLKGKIKYSNIKG